MLFRFFKYDGDESYKKIRTELPYRSMLKETASYLEKVQASWYLKSLSMQKQEVQKIYGEIVGYGATSDAYHNFAGT